MCGVMMGTWMQVPDHCQVDDCWFLVQNPLHLSSRTSAADSSLNATRLITLKTSHIPDVSVQRRKAVWPKLLPTFFACVCACPLYKYLMWVLENNKSLSLLLTSFSWLLSKQKEMYLIGTIQLLVAIWMFLKFMSIMILENDEQKNGVSSLRRSYSCFEPRMRCAHYLCRIGFMISSVICFLLYLCSIKEESFRFKTKVDLAAKRSQMLT